MLLLICFMLSGCPGGGDYTAKKDYLKAEREFIKLKDQWEAESPQLSSNTYDYWKTQAGKKIISMGKRALPLVMNEIREGNFFFNVAAERITNISLRSGEPSGSEQQYSEKWVEWWEKNKENPNWNIYIDYQKKHKVLRSL